MKILAVSDSHGTLRYLEEAVEREQPNLIVHLGDRERDAQRLSEHYPQVPMLSVPGNCDHPFSGRQLTLLRELENVRVMITHGHPYGVKSGLLTIELAAREAGAGVVMFGHTHRAFCEQHNGLWLLNPGACGGGRPSYGVVQLTDGEAVCWISDFAEED